MSQATRLQTQLSNVRRLSEAFLKDFQKPEEWLFQVHPTANHALWFVGHMAVMDNFFVGLLDPRQAIDLGPYDDLFGMGSQPSPQMDDYPPPVEVLAAMRDRRRALLNLLSKLDDEALGTRMPPGLPEMWQDKAGIFESVIWHESLHAGQVSIARKSLGYPPILQ